MYLFHSLLPCLPVEYRRKLCHSIGILWMGLQEGRIEMTDGESRQIEYMNVAIGCFEMQRAELLGLTNTSINPMEL